MAAPVAAPVAATPVPADAIVQVVPAVSVFFQKAEKPSAEIQKELFAAWADDYVQRSIKFAEESMGTVLQTVHWASERERSRIELSAREDLHAEKAAVNAECETASAAIAFVRLKLDDVEKTNENMNLKFLKCFGVFMKDWDGTEAHIHQLILEKNQKLGKK